MNVAPILMVVVLTVTLFGASALLVAGCTLKRPTPHNAPAQFPANNSDEPRAVHAPVITRVGGDYTVAYEYADGEYRSGKCRITTPLPEGYPAPTPPGAIELKRYPSVRRAQITGTMTPDWGMNFAFFPLFNHIKRREIAMTAPVEMNYEGIDAASTRKPDSWTMSFLYRAPELGATGSDPKDQRVLIEDLPPVTVVALGMRGPYKLTQVKSGISTLQLWLSTQSEWEAAGEPRALFYNGPEARSQDKWAEVQIPVRPRTTAAPPSPVRGP
jgi:hypothetical protein